MLGTEQGVTDLTNNTNSALIYRQLVEARAELASILSKNGLIVPDTNGVLNSAVNFLASALIAIQPGAVNPTSNFKTEDFARDDWSNESQFDIYHKRAIGLIEDYVVVINGGGFSMPPQSFIVGERGVRIGAYTENAGD